MMEAHSSKNWAMTMHTPAAISCVGWMAIDTKANVVATINEAMQSPPSILRFLNISTRCFVYTALRSGGYPYSEGLLQKRSLN